MLFVVPLAVSACADAPRSRLEKICDVKAGVIVTDPAAWALYIRHVQRTDLADQKANLDGRAKDTVISPVDEERFIRPFPYVPGYEYALEHTHYDGDQLPTGIPHSNKVIIKKEGRVIGALRDFEVMQDNFEDSRILTCSNSYPKVYGIVRTAVLR